MSQGSIDNTHLAAAHCNVARHQQKLPSAWHRHCMRRAALPVLNARGHQLGLSSELSVITTCCCTFMLQVDLLLMWLHVRAQARKKLSSVSSDKKKYEGQLTELLVQSLAKLKQPATIVKARKVGRADPSACNSVLAGVHTHLCSL